MNEPTIIPVERTGPPPIVRIGLVGAAAAALIAVGILAAATSATPNGTLAANTTTGSSNATTPLANGGPWAGGPGDADGPGGPNGIHGLGGITITAISGSNLSLKTADGWTRTITVDSATTYQRAGATIKISDLAVGDEISFRESRQSNGTWKITAIEVIPPHVDGTISAIAAGTITVKQADGTSATITVGSGTTYDVAGKTGATFADLKTGMVVMASGSLNGSGSLAATAIRAFDPSAMAGPATGGFGHGRRGFGMGPWQGDGATPNASAAPSASSGTSAG